MLCLDVMFPIHFAHAQDISSGVQRFHLREAQGISASKVENQLLNFNLYFYRKVRQGSRISLRNRGGALRY